MPYTHFHNWSIHTHHRRPKGGNHDRAIRRRQRPWRIGFVVIIVAAMLGGAGWLIRWEHENNTIQSAATDALEAQSARQQAQRETRVAEDATRQEQHERKVVELINDERAQRGIGTLTWDARLQAIARAHSRDMADNDYFSHTNKAGQSHRERALDAGYQCRNRVWGGVAENIYFGTTGYRSPQSAVTSWLGSPGHRRAMLDGTFQKAAIGIHDGYLSGYGNGYYTTLMLC